MKELMDRGQHAVVLGASMAGLLAARVLADFYDRVTVVDRDALPEAPANRRGVPQGRHVHLLWGRGFRVLQEFFAGFGDELIAAGVPIFDGDLSKVYLSTGGHPLRRSGHIKNFQLLTASMPLLEFKVRRRVTTLTNVDVLQGHDIVELTFSAAKDAVTAAVIRSRRDGIERVLEADLVVDATGRGARTPAFLEAKGYGCPVEEHVDVRLMYSSQLLRLPPGMLNEVAVVVGPVPGRPTGMAIFRNDDDTWILTVIGMPGR